MNHSLTTALKRNLSKPHASNELKHGDWIYSTKYFSFF